MVYCIELIERIFGMISEDLYEKSMYKTIFEFKLLIAETKNSENNDAGIAELDKLMEFSLKNLPSKVQMLKRLKGQFYYNALEYEKCIEYTEKYLKECVPDYQMQQVLVMLNYSNYEIGGTKRSYNYSQELKKKGLFEPYLHVLQDIYDLKPSRIIPLDVNEQGRKNLESIQRVDRLTKPFEKSNNFG